MGPGVMFKAAVFAVLLLALFSGCSTSGEQDGGGAPPNVTVGSKNSTEQIILGELYAQALEEEGFMVERSLGLESQPSADQALLDGEIDLYPEYTGTALVELFGYDRSEYPETPEETYEEARSRYAGRETAATLLTPADVDSNYAVFVRREIAQRQNLRTLDDLAAASPDLTFVSSPKFQDREDGFPNMLRSYPNLDFERIVPVNAPSLRYRGVERGEADAGVGFRTDGQLTSKELTLLRDEKQIWPFRYPVPVVRDEALSNSPEIEEILDRVSATLNTGNIRRLNGRVDVNGEDPENVAASFLVEQGLV